MRLNNTSLYSSIQLDEASLVPENLQILRVGKFNHPEYGFFEITAQTLAEMKLNFDNRIRGIDMAFDYYHDSNNDASAWVKNLELKENGTELWANVSWTPKARQKLSERELRYFSPDFAFKWKDPETGSTFNNVLFGGGLTNRPFVKEMMAIVADEKLKGLSMTELEKTQKEVADLKAQNLKLSEEKMAIEKKMSDDVAEESAEVVALKKQIADLQALLAKAQSDQEMMMADKKKIEAEKVLAEKTAAFNVLLSEGKACAAQKDAFLKNDMPEFIKLAQPLNLKANGSSNGAADTDESTKVENILKLAETMRKSDSKLSHAASISLAKKEIEKSK